MSMSKHLKLSSFTIPADAKNPLPIETSCVVSFSNYCWFDRVKDAAPKLVKCTKHDFDISFKLSSGAFQTSRNANSDYHFDKQGVKLTYDQCYTLFRSEEFVLEFLGKIKKYYDRDLDMNVPPPIEDDLEVPATQQPEEEILDVEQMDEEEPERPGKKKPLRNSIQQYSIKRLKQL